MRNHHNHHHQLRLTLATALKWFIILKALLPNGAQLAKGAGAKSCYGESSISCPKLKLNVSVLFPFVSSPECAGEASSFVISGCDGPDNEKPTWPQFVNATAIKTLNASAPPPPPRVMSVASPFNLSTKDPNVLNPDFGLINLTWSDGPTTKNACQSLAPRHEISQYLPQPINLTSFAHSVFQLTPSNTILLFNCSNISSSSPPSPQTNSAACRSFEAGCHLLSSNCSQLTPDSKELNLSSVMESLNCESAMFFVIRRFSISDLSLWKPGLIELNWSTTSNDWMSSNLKSCQGCLQTNGTCGYNADDNFQCYCSNNTVSSTNCTAANNTSRGMEPLANNTQDPGEPDAHKSCSNFKCRVGPKIAFVAGGFIAALSLSLAVFCIRKRKSYLKASVPCSSPHINRSWMKKPSFLSRKQDPISAKEMSYQEIVHATESFADTHMLGDGGFGTVFKGVLADGRKVAVKRLYHDNYRRMEYFYNEIKVLSNLDHPNLIKLFGFCCEDDKELLLVFEYASQGTVSDHLHSASKPPLSWKLRLDIACETAEALSYLHNSVVPPIYHRDVKTTNILLDEGLHVKLADFGLSKFVPLKATHVSTAPQGTPGYLDPDYHQCYQLTDKSDVYSLGVVLMELISSKLAVDMSRDRGEINLSTLAVMKIKCGRLEELVDPSLEMKKSACLEGSIRRVVELAFQCLQTERDERPTMSSVAETLTDIRREYSQNEGGDGEDPPNTHTRTTTSQLCVPVGPNKSFQHPLDSPCSVFFSSGSSNPSSIVSSS